MMSSLSGLAFALYAWGAAAFGLDSHTVSSFQAPVLVLVEPWHSVENMCLNYLVIASCIALVGIILALFVAQFIGLGPVLSNFFSVAGTEARDAETVTVDALSAKEQSSKKGEHSANFAQSIDEEDITFLKMILRKHGPNDFRAMVCLAWTFVHGAVSLYLLHNFPSWWSVLISGAFVVRGFIVFHDACHNSFFTNPSWNRKLAWIFSTFIPQNASDWTKSHNHHHRHLGRFDIMDFSLTVWFSEKEYRSMPLLLQIAYRIIRDPFILPNLLSAHVFWLFPFIKGPVETAINRLSFYAPLYALLGQKTTLLYLTSTWVGGIIGIQLFHLQHQCNTPYRVTPPIHSKWDAGMLGSTYLLMPWPLSFMTLGIEYHHIHHASTQVPCYNLAACHDEGTRWSHSKDVAGKSGSKPNLWERAGVNVVGPKRAFLSLFHTLFEGDVKYEEEGKPLPRFTSFDIYNYLGLVDTEC